MKSLSLISLASLLVLPSAFAADRVECSIENPCAWTRPDRPGQPPALSYCLKTLRGTTEALELTLESPQGRPVGKKLLRVKKFDRRGLVAASADGRYAIDAKPYGDGYSGGIVVKPEKVGLYLYCERNSKTVRIP